jgi:hypothetical protein
VLDAFRPVQIVVAGKVVAETWRARFLFETRLPTRYYISPEASGERRFHWTVTILGRSRTIAEGAGKRAEARWAAEVALGADAADWPELSPQDGADPRGPCLATKRLASASAASSSVKSTDTTTSTPS